MTAAHFSKRRTLSSDHVPGGWLYVPYPIISSTRKVSRALNSALPFFPCRVPLSVQRPGCRSPAVGQMIRRTLSCDCCRSIPMRPADRVLAVPLPTFPPLPDEAFHGTSVQPPPFRGPSFCPGPLSSRSAVTVMYQIFPKG